MQPEGPILFPLLYLERGRVVRPEGEGYIAVRNDSEPVDFFDVTDRLFSQYHRLYLVDVDGLMSNRPQLDYLQEISRGQEVWVEAGPRTADQVIDVLVAGASRAVLSTDTLASPGVEIRQALALTDEIALLLVTEGDKVVSPDRTLQGSGQSEFYQTALGWGVTTFILSTHPEDWESVADLARRGRLFVKGVRSEEIERLRASGVAGAMIEVNERS